MRVIRGGIVGLSVGIIVGSSEGASVCPPVGCSVNI